MNRRFTDLRRVYGARHWRDERGSSGEQFGTSGAFGLGVTSVSGPSGRSRDLQSHDIGRQLRELITQVKEIPQRIEKEGSRTRECIGECEDGTRTFIKERNSELRALVEEKGTELHTLVAGRGDAMEALVEEKSTQVQTLLAEHSDAIQAVAETSELTQQGVNANREMLRSQLAEKFDTPRLACVLRPWDFYQSENLSTSEQEAATWVNRLEANVFKKKDFFKTEMRLFLVCAKTHRLVPCGPLGQGYNMLQVRKWVKRAVGVANMLLRITSASVCGAIGAGLASTVLDGALAETLTVAQEETESALTCRLERLAVSDVDASTEGQQLVSRENVAKDLEADTYEVLREFVRGAERTEQAKTAREARDAKRKGRPDPNSRTFIFFKDIMEIVHADDGGTTAWVLKGEKNAWLNARKAGASP